MSFDNILNERIKRKAKYREEKFYKEFEEFLRKYNLHREVMFDGLQRYQPKDSNNARAWRDIVFDKFMELETIEFINEIERIRYYLENENK